MIDSLNLNAVDVVRCVAIVVAAASTLFTEKRGQMSAFMKFDALVNFCFGIGALFFPRYVLSYQTQVKPDAMHIMLAQILGASLLSLVALYYFAVRTRHSSAVGSYLLARTMSLIVMLVNAFNAQQSSYITKQFASFTIFPLVILVVGYILHLLRFGEFNELRVGRSTAGDRTPVHVLVDLLFTAPIFLSLFAFTSDALISLKLTLPMGPVHQMVVRQIVAIMLTTFIFGLLSIQSTSEQDRRSYFITRLVVFSLSTALIAYYQNRYSIFRQPSRFMLIPPAVVGTNVLLGLFNRSFRIKQAA